MHNQESAYIFSNIINYFAVFYNYNKKATVNNITEVIILERKKNKRNSHRDNKATDKNIVSPKFGRKNEDIPTDILGSYTGVPLDPLEMPVQDADDL